MIKGSVKFYEISCKLEESFFPWYSIEFQLI
jgi:hypothetical protein